MWGISYWFFPLFASLVWLAMLLALLLTWVIDGKPHYPSMDPSQRIAYISDIGAQSLKPLFIAMSAVTVVSFNLGFIAERWLRHRGTLVQNTSFLQKLWAWLSIVAAILGGAGLILLSVFDTVRHTRIHNTFLGIFIAGYIISAIFTCLMYQRLGRHFREYRILRISFWIKLAFILIEVALAIAFGVSQKTGRYNTAAVVEWVVALIFTFYVLSFFIDFIPAHRTKHHQSRQTMEEMAMADANDNSQDNLYRPSGHSAYKGRYGYANGAMTSTHPNTVGLNANVMHSHGHPQTAGATTHPISQF